MAIQDMIYRFSHHHPLTAIPESRMRKMSLWCRGCKRFFRAGEVAYECSSNMCWYDFHFHKECLEMPSKIRHPSHPLKQEEWSGKVSEIWICAVCKDPIRRTWEGYYICSEGCHELFIHLTCAVDVDNLDAGDEEVMMKHPSHTRHELRCLRRSCSFQCDARGTSDEGSWFGCSICQYWIHESCACLPHTASFPPHHHPLSLAFCLPREYIIYEYDCDVCKGALRFKQWVYHCQLCRYVAHVKCATDTSLATINKEDEVVGSYVKFPIDKVDEELIKPFVARKIEDKRIVNLNEDNNIINGKYHFHNHPHPLKLIISSSSSSHYNNDDDDEEDEQSGIFQLLCDGCTMPIHEQKQSSSPSNYLSCEECKYFLHVVCFDLPLELMCLPVHSHMDHRLRQRSSNKLTNWAFCSICSRSTNGLYYDCNKCSFIVDVNCASLPDTIKHEAHPQRHHYLKLDMGGDVSSICVGCYTSLAGTQVLSYRCDSCIFTLCRNCVPLPATNKHKSEKHLLSLTYDASVNHPSEFYCGDCEKPMNPKSWMYHCRDCDQSFHPWCFPASSGWFRNINFGTQEYMITPCHPHHPLKFQLITKKKYCDMCHREIYDRPGFQCASCNFAMCFFVRCGKQYLETIKAINYQ